MYSPWGLERSRRRVPESRQATRRKMEMLQVAGSRAASASRNWQMALKVREVGILPRLPLVWAKYQSRKASERTGKERAPSRDGAGTRMKARPSVARKRRVPSRGGSQGSRGAWAREFGLAGLGWRI